MRASSLLPRIARLAPAGSAGLGLFVALVACGSLDSNTSTSPTLATLQGSLTNPQSVAISGGAVRVAVVWRGVSSGEFAIAQDLPVQPVFPSSFSIQLDGPPPVAAMNPATPPPTPVPTPIPPPPEVEADGGPPPDASVTSQGRIVNQDDPITEQANLQYAVGTVVAYADQNANGKLDLVPLGSAGYVDQIVATNTSLAVVYFEGAIPSWGSFGDQSLNDGAGNSPVPGYNLFNLPACVAPYVSTNPVCTAVTTPGSGKCPATSWLSITTQYPLIVASTPEVADLMCLSTDDSGLSETGSGPAGPYDPSNQPATYPDPCDPNLDCSTDGSQYIYQTCQTVSKGICEGTYLSCTALGYARPTRPRRAGPAPSDEEAVALVDAPLRPEEVSALYAKYGFFLLRRCRMILRDCAMADDALQETFVNVMRAGAAVREVSEPLRWLYRVTDRCCFDVLRKRRRSVETPGGDGDEGASAHPAVAIEVRDVVLRLLGTFDEKEMQIALLLFVDGLSQGEIAAEVGVSRVTVNKKVQAIRARAYEWLGRIPAESAT